MSTSADSNETPTNAAGEVIEKGKAVLSAVREDIPVVREAISELRSSPQDALSKLIQVCKDVWQKIVEVGLLGAIADSIKALIASFSASTSTSQSENEIPHEAETLASAMKTQTTPLLG